jgi:hypothetical protein
MKKIARGVRNMNTSLEQALKKYGMQDGLIKVEDF